MKTDKTFTRFMRGTSLVAALAVWGLVQQPAAAMTLEEAVRLSLETNPDVAITEDGRDIAVRELRQARGLYLPQIDLNSAIGRERINNNTTRGMAGSDHRTLTREEYRVIGTQRISTALTPPVRSSARRPWSTRPRGACAKVPSLSAWMRSTPIWR